MKLIEIRKLKASYNNHVAIENINIDINEKDYICLVGENGSRQKYIN